MMPCCQRASRSTTLPVGLRGRKPSTRLWPRCSPGCTVRLMGGPSPELPPAGGPAGGAPARQLWGVAAVAAVALLVAAIAVVATVPQPDATLRANAAEPDELVLRLLATEAIEWDFHSSLRGASEMEIDASTLRGFGAYRDIEVWSATNIFQSSCLIGVHRQSSDIFARRCAPEGADVMIDTMWHGLDDGERLRFVLRGDTVDAYLLVPEERR